MKALSHIPPLICTYTNLSPLRCFHRNCYELGQVNKAILLFLNKQISSYAYLLISGGNTVFNHILITLFVNMVYTNTYDRIFSISIYYMYTKFVLCQRKIQFSSLYIPMSPWCCLFYSYHDLI